MSLLETQEWMGHFLKRPIREMGRFRLPIYDEKTIQEIRERISSGPNLSAEERLGLIHQQFWFRMFVLMQERYPTLLSLFGYADFNFLLAEPYILKYFPDHWSLDLFGRHLPRWIEEEYHEEDRSLVLAIAKLDAAHERWTALGESCELYFDYDLEPFRQKLLEHPPTYWQDHDFPELRHCPENRVLIGS